ncbi:1-acyl-sn-glycerol-3-phosphate acyltransferase [bacterium]|nr:1-acyl-sn-glycerol-3-phosphate acyltransferase [bacterium]
MAPERTPFYRLAQNLLKLGFSTLQGMRVEGLEHVPAEGGCLIVSNHTSWLDPPVLGCSLTHRQIHFMAKRELFERPYLGKVIRWLGAFPVERGQADRKSLRMALNLLTSGRVVCLFPEGTRGDGQKMEPWHVGMAMLAHNAQVDVIPAALVRTRNLLEDRQLHLPRQPMRVRFGPAISTQAISGPSKARLAEIQERCYQGVEALLVEMR